MEIDRVLKLKQLGKLLISIKKVQFPQDNLTLKILALFHRIYS